MGSLGDNSYWVTETDLIAPAGPSGSSVFIATVILAVLASISFGLRVWARLLISAWGTDDWLMLLGWALFLAQPVLTPLSHVGHHYRAEFDIPGGLTHAEYEIGKKYYFFIGILYTINTTIVKLSICALMLRVARHKLHHWICNIVIVISILSCLIRVVSWLARCKDLRDNWDIVAEYSPLSCAPKAILTHVSIFFSTICILTDLVCAGLPAAIVWNLQMEWKSRISVIIMLGMGVGATIVTTIRVKYLFTYEQQHNVLVHMAPIALYSNLETALGIIGACIGTMRPLLQYLPRVPGTTVQAHRLQRLESNRKPRSRQSGDIDGMGSQTFMLEDFSPANAADQEDGVTLVHRYDTSGEGETAQHTLD